MKQIGLGLIQYSQDYDELMVRDWYGLNGFQASDPATNKYKWMDAVFPYVKSEQIFTCPSDTRTNLYRNYRNLTAPSAAYGSYRINNAYGNAAGNSPTQPPCSNGGGTQFGPLRDQNLSTLAAPSSTVWVLDSADAQSPGGEGAWIFWPVGTTPTYDALATPRTFGGTGDQGKVIERHLETTVVLYTDSHAKSQKLSSLITPGTGGVFQYFTVADDPN